MPSNVDVHSRSSHNVDIGSSLSYALDCKHDTKLVDKITIADVTDNTNQSVVHKLLVRLKRGSHSFQQKQWLTVYRAQQFLNFLKIRSFVSNRTSPAGKNMP